MATKQVIEKHLKIALKEIGKIEPWFDKEFGEWIFSSPLYPVEYGGESKEEVIENYPKYLREFISHRLNDRLDSLVEKATKGHGGKRIGAGRPKGSKRASRTKTVRLKKPIADWAKSHENIIGQIMEGELIVVAAKPYDHSR